MSGIKVKVMYLFEAQPGTGEMTVREGETLTVTRTDVGEGWWEGTNPKGQTGLFPAAYVEEMGSEPPQDPPPPLPISYANTQDFTPPPTTSTSNKEDWAADWGFGPMPTSTSTTAVTTEKKATTPQPQNLLHEDEWDDEWDDDDSEPGGVQNGSNAGYGFPQQPSRTVVKQTTSMGDVSIAGLGKFNVEDRDKIYIDDDGTAPFWRRSNAEYTCSISSPTKESKFHGMKSYIAYTITPSTTHQPVARRYKHFDWLHERLSVKFTMVPIPPLPEKQIAGRFENDLIEYRMTMLQSWIDRICQHPVLSHCDVLKHFITCPNDEKTWKAGKRKHESDKLVGVNLYQAIVRPDQPLDLKITEEKLESYGRFFNHLDEATKGLQVICVDQAKKHQVAYKREYNKISLAFSKLSRAFDMDPSNIAPHLTDGIRQVADAYQDIGTIFSEEPKHDWDPLSNLLYEYKGLIDGFPTIVNGAKSSVSKRKQMEKDSAEGKADHEQVPPIIHRSDTIIYSLHAEVTNFHNIRQRDFKVAMTSFLTEQINFYQKVTDRLRDTLEHFNKI